VPLPDKPAVDPLPPPASDLPLSTDARDIISPLTNLERFTYDPDTFTGVPPTDTRRDTGPALTASVNAADTGPLRRKNDPRGLTRLSARDIRGDHQGTSSLEVCIDTAGRVTSASLASSSGYGSLDQAALKWVRDRKFTPAKLDGQPQSICGHPWSLRVETQPPLTGCEPRPVQAGWPRAPGRPTFRPALLEAPLSISSWEGRFFF